MSKTNEILLSANYSHKLRDLVACKLVRLDLFKTPAWPDLVAEAGELLPVNVHFPLTIGTGIGDALNSETNLPADWNLIERLLNTTATRFVNLHLAPT